LAGSVPAMNTAYQAIGRGGSVVVAGLAPTGAEFSFQPSQIVSDEKSILGSYMGSCVPTRDIPRFIELYEQGKLPVDRLIDRSIGFDEVNEGFDRLAQGATVRQILLPHGV
jgi:alcohol dehydrogenase